MAKYYKVTTYTPYCGENIDHYLRIEDDEHIEYYEETIWDWADEDAYEWWDEQAKEDYDNDFGEYHACCGYIIEEVSAAEYAQGYRL